MPRRGLHFVLVAGLLAVSSLAASPARPAEPWDEKAVGSHVSQGTLQGMLPENGLRELVARGQLLFTSKFTLNDGAGRPLATQAIIPTKRKRPAAFAVQRLAGPDSSACSSCHNDPVPGGAGDFTVNAFVSEGFTNTEFDTVDPQFSNERNTNHIFGSGLVELLAREMTVELHAIRKSALQLARETAIPQTVPLTAKGVDFGKITANPDGILDLEKIDGVDTDLVIRPFSQKGVMTSLRQFTVNAMNDHHGMQPTERFGARWTGSADFDEDGHADELSEGDISALVAWQATLPPPVPTAPAEPRWAQATRNGDHIFDAVGCAACHVRSLPLNSLVFTDPGPDDAAGTLRASDVAKPAGYDLGRQFWAFKLARTPSGQILVPLFGDLKRHQMTDRQVTDFGNELLSQRFVDRDVFQTAELWGIGSTAPYGHRGDMTTLDETIRAHGGSGRESRDAYLDLFEDDRRALIAFLKSLVIAP